MISASIVAHSKCANTGKEIVTFELIYPRFIHIELLVHRLFSRNAASSRAIPASKMIEQVRNAPAMPIHWGKNQPGMQAKEELGKMTKAAVICEWEEAAVQVAVSAKAMSDMGAHKQVVNRLLEPFQWMKTVVTATEWDNWFWLRNHSDAQPEIKRLAEVMLESLQTSVPNHLEPGEWHVPYYEHGKWDDRGGARDKFCRTLQEALAISSSCCAQVSYRQLDDSLEKAQMIYHRLVESEPVHASPFEHQATPMASSQVGNLCPSVNLASFPGSWQDGITHCDKHGRLWSGNFKGWVQHRQLIPNNTKWGKE